MVAGRRRIRGLALAGALLAALATATAAQAAPGDLDAAWTACGGVAGTACTGSNGLSSVVYGLGVDADGSLRVATAADTFDGQSSGGRFKRLAPDGTLAAGWPTAAGFNNPSYASAVTPDGRTYVAGHFFGYSSGTTISRDFVARLDATGALEAGWQGCYLNDCAANNGLNSNAYAIALDSSNVPIVGGSFSGYNFGASNPAESKYVSGIVKLTAGDVAASWVCRGGVNPGAIVRAIAVQPDGKIIIGGNFTDYRNQGGVGSGCVAGPAGTQVTRSLIARLNADGSLDTSWTACGATAGAACTGTNGILTTGASVRALELQPDGRVLVGGTFTQFDGATANYVLRLNADGTRDASFLSGSGPGVGPSGAVNAIELHPTGRIFLGGEFTFVNGSTCPKVARLLEDGALDPSWTCAFASLDGSVNAVAYDTSSRRLFAGGAFTEIGGVQRSYVAALSGVSAPSAPLSPTATAGVQSAVVEWSAPSSSDGLPVTAYAVTGSPSGSCTTTGGTTCTITGLTPGTAYTFTVTASSSAGAGAASAATAPVTPTAAVPSAPRSPSAVAGDARATVSWTAPASDGGAAITGYVVTGSPGGSCTTTGATTCEVTGLANGTAYIFTVTAANAVGTGPASDASSPVTPSAGGSSTDRPEASISAGLVAAGEAAIVVRWSAGRSTAATTLRIALPKGVAFGASPSRCATDVGGVVSIAVPELAAGDRGACRFSVETRRRSATLTLEGGATTASARVAEPPATASAWVRAVLRILDTGTPRATLNATLDGVRAGRVARLDAARTIRREVLAVRKRQIRMLADLPPAPASLTGASRLLRRSLVQSAAADRSYAAWLEGDPTRLGRAITFSLMATESKVRLLAALRGHGVAIPPASTTWP